MSDIQLKNIDKSFGKVKVLHDVNMDVKDGEFVVFVGPSGCGKSTLLRVIAGLEKVSAGKISIDNTTVNDVQPRERGIAMVFQSYALYPHMTVYKNMSFGLKLKKHDKQEIDRRVRQAAETLQLTKYLNRRPAELSGGQRQRVAIGRAIVRKPKVFLFDEPLSNLDAALRVQTRIEIAKLHKKLEATIIYVTHDQVEAMTLADKIVVLHDGRVEQVGAPLELYNAPANRFVAGFIGSPKMNFLNGIVKSVREKTVTIEFSGNRHISITHPNPGTEKNAVTVGIRPEHLILSSPEKSLLRAEVDVVERLGDVSYLYCTLSDGTAIIASTPGTSGATTGDHIHLTARIEKIHVFGSDGTAWKK
ncbi:sn-glycerol-3-phosphate ABC transporter ATP-binding protein UgpC [Pseudodesulfovibrio sp. JC047]|uniref:ABC transporter ATP-binding protein n=1 Tax=Pseudodesulfovibrio sp. JC047 TaxID=2683199 RepID=UPI0013D5FCCC|nr:sn-glycerol-3-phosphate ABC transporter ATP-binding protein UgpC [Pseudodesulfovibrio sp. JC047]NDV18686.1 sn-glycerol-3-phosphate ABC transporter ATP-binding protein UgpC [Pseudodesulfovibrio sp. JC047]